MVSEPPRPSVVMSLVVCETPWNPATIATSPSASAASMRPGVTSMILALPCSASVMTPACEPVNDRASWPSVPIAIARTAIADALAGGQQHVELAARRQRRDLVGEVDELIGGVAHGGDHDDDVVTGLLGRDDALGDALDAGCVGNRGAAVLLDDNAHEMFLGAGKRTDCATLRATSLPVRRRWSQSRSCRWTVRSGHVPMAALPIVVRPSNARPRVSSSAYSRSPPTGRPLASLLTRRPSGVSMRMR